MNQHTSRCTTRSSRPTSVARAPAEARSFLAHRSTPLQGPREVKILFIICFLLLTRELVLSTMLSRESKTCALFPWNKKEGQTTENLLLLFNIRKILDGPRVALKKDKAIAPPYLPFHSLHSTPLMLHWSKYEADFFLCGVRRVRYEWSTNHHQGWLRLLWNWFRFSIQISWHVL